MSVEQKPDPQSTYWNDRFERYRHTGWNTPEIYKYDQKIRIRAILRALKALKVDAGPNHRVLDIGCGTGDVIEALAVRGAEVVGYDVSSGVIEQARARFAGNPNVTLECANLIDAQLQHGPFDLITSVTVLQHQVEDHALAELISKLARALKPDGRILILETVVPEGSAGEGVDHYIRPRTRSEWLTRFEAAGLHLAYESSYPQAALTTYARIRGMVRKLKPGTGQTAASAARPSTPGLASKVRRRVLYVGLRGFLAVFVPLDHWLRIPTPAGAGSGRILAFAASVPAPAARR